MLCNKLVRYFIVLALVLAITVTSQGTKPKGQPQSPPAKTGSKPATTTPAAAPKGSQSGTCSKADRQTGVCVKSINDPQEKATSIAAQVTGTGAKKVYSCPAGNFVVLLCCKVAVSTRIGTNPGAGAPKPPSYSTSCDAATATTPSKTK